MWFRSPQAGGAATSAETERRGGPRDASSVQLDILQAGPGADPAASDDALVAWSRDVSSTGICFRSLLRLEPGRVLVRRHEGERHQWVELEIVRRRELPNGVWEYGASVRDHSPGAVYEIPHTEFTELVAAMRERRTAPAGGGARPRTTGNVMHAEDTGERGLLLSLREVANRSTKSALRIHRMRKRTRRLREAQLALIAAGGALLGASLARVSVSMAVWQAFVLAASGLFLADWYLSCQLRDE
jgi:hypothetical protein